jgi:hypothetical protein
MGLTASGYYRLNRTGRLSGSGGGVPLHATCTTQDIESWWYLKFRLLCGKVKGYFMQRPSCLILRDYRTLCPITDSRRFDTVNGALLERTVPKVCKAASFPALL